MKKHLLPIFLIIILFSAVSLSSTNNVVAGTKSTTLETLNEEDNAIAISISLNGVVLYKQSNATYWDEVFKGTKFYPLDIIKTSSSSFCELQLKQGHVLRLEPNSTFTLNDLNKDHKPINKFKLSIGKVWAKVIKGTSDGNNFTIETPHASISVKGTLFSVLAPFGNVSAFEGIVEVMRNNISVLVEEGFETNVDQDSTGLPDAEPLSDETMDSFNDFKDQSSLTDTELSEIEKKLKEKKNKDDKPAGTNASSVDGNSPPATDMVKSFMDGIGEFFDGLIKAIASGSSESSMLTDVKDKFINQDNLIVRNPSLLAQLNNTNNGLYHFDFGSTNGMLIFALNKKSSTYRYGIGNVPSNYNSGPNNNVSDIMEFAYNQISKGSILGLYLQQDQSANFYGADVYAKKIQKATLLYGVSFPIILNLNAGVLVKGTFAKAFESTTPYTKLNAIRNSGIIDTSFEELMTTSNRYETESSDYSANAGLSFPVTGWWTVGVGVDNILYSQNTSTNLTKPLTHYTSIFHYEKMLLYFDYEPKEQSLILDTQVSLANVPYLGKVLVGTRLEQNTTQETSDYFTSFKLWIFQLTAKQRIIKPLTLGTFNIDQYTSLGFKLDF